MNRRIHFCVAVFLAASLSAFAGQVTSTEKITRDIPLDLGGSFAIDNGAGDIEIIGAEVPNLQLTAIKKIIGVDQAALQEGKEATQISIEGDPAFRLVRTVTPPARSQRWGANVSYTLRVPRYCHVRIASRAADRIRVSNMIANVIIKAFNGAIQLDGVSGATAVESINSNIVYNYTARPVAHLILSTVNGNIEVHVPADANFDWVAEALQGDFLTNLPVRARMSGSKMLASVNSPGGPTITTKTAIGKVLMLQSGVRAETARSVLNTAPINGTQKTAGLNPQSLGPSQTEAFRISRVSGNFIKDFNIVNVELGEVQGDTRVTTRAGAIQIEKVWGSCYVLSAGGPVNLGEIIGAVDAHTHAGDILVRAALDGGRLETDGGSVRLLYNAGPATLRTAGGDIVVSQAAGAISAETLSGDITINSDLKSKSLHIEARTALGNITLSIPPRFGAEIDATVITSDADAPTPIESEFGGLSIKRDQFNGKTRIHATGKINGGGEKVMLNAEGGNIRITALTTAPITLTK